MVSDNELKYDFIYPNYFLFPVEVINILTFIYKYYLVGCCWSLRVTWYPYFHQLFYKKLSVSFQIHSLWSGVRIAGQGLLPFSRCVCWQGDPESHYGCAWWLWNCGNSEVTVQWVTLVSNIDHPHARQDKTGSL